MPLLPGTNSQFDFKLPPKPKAKAKAKAAPRKPVVLPKKEYDALPASVKKGKPLTSSQYSKLSPSTRMALAGGFLAASRTDRAIEAQKQSAWEERMRKGTHAIERNYKAQEAARKKAAKSEPIHLAGFSLPRLTSRNIRNIGEIATNAAGDFPELYKGLKDFGKVAGRAGLSDLKTGRGIIGVTGTFNPFVQVYRAKEGTTFSALNPRGKRSEFDKISEPLVRGLPASYAALADPSVWKKDPVLQLLNAGSIVFPAARLGGIGKLSAGFRAANPWMTTAQAAKAALVESYRPGMMAANGIEGGIAQRLIRGAEGRTIPNPRPTSKSPLGRYGQRAFEDISTKVGIRNPNSRWGGDARISAAQRRSAAQAQAAREARWAPTVDALIQGVKADSPGGWQKFKEAFAGIVRTDPERGAVVMAALQGPKSAGLKDAGNLAVQEMGARLSENAIHRATQDSIDASRAAVDEIDNQIEELTTALSEDGLNAAEIQPMIDHLRSQRSLFAEEALRQSEQLDFELGRTVHPVRDSPQREHILQVLTDQYGADTAAEKIRYMDAIARAQEPDMPQRWYHQVSVQRATDASGLQDPLFQRELPRTAPEWAGNPYRVRRQALEAGDQAAADAIRPPFKFEDAVGSKTRAQLGGAKGASKVKPNTRSYSLSDRLKRITTNIEAGQVDDFARWYETLWDWMAYVYGPERAQAAGNAFLASQAALSPIGGVQTVAKVMDILRTGEKRVPRTDKGTPTVHTTADNIAALLQGEDLGTNPNMIAAKLSDFFDSAYGRSVRSIMEDGAGGGGPGVVDRWTMRSDGFIDNEMQRYVKNVLKKDPKTFKYDNITSPAVYEYSSQRLNQLTQEANTAKLFGRENWTVDQIQALDWFATRKEFNTAMGNTDEVGGWRGAMQGSMHTVTGDITSRMRKSSIEDIVDRAGGSIPTRKNVETQGATVAVTFVGTTAAAGKVAREMADLSGGTAYHIYPRGMGSAKDRIPILTITGTKEELRAAQEALKGTDGTGDPLLLARDDGFDLIFADEKGTRLGTPAVVEAMIAKARGAVTTGTLVRDDRLLEATRGRASSGYRAGDPQGIATSALGRRDAGTGVRFTEQPREVSAGYAEAQAAASGRAWNLSVPDSADLTDGTVVIHANEAGVGYALSPETGYLGFIHNNSQIRGAGMDAVLEGLLAGGHHLDAYDGFLPATYSAFGFREVGRMKFDPRYAPDGWNITTDGTPDIVFMAYAPSLQVKRAAYITDWEKAQAKAQRIGAREFEATPPQEFLSSQTALHQRARPKPLSPVDHQELSDLYAERQKLKADRGGDTIFSDREQAVQARIAELESQTEGTILGATEGVGTPRRRITLMPGARNGTLTFEHEMLHSTVQSLDKRGQDALSEVYAGDNPVPEWTTAQHEAVARGYEKWKRNPKDVPQIVHDAFSRMEQGGYHNTVLLDSNQVNQVQNQMRDIVQGLRSGDQTKMAAAADAAELIAQESEAALIRILSYNRTPEQVAKIQKALDDRRNLLTDLYRKRGIIGPKEEARAFVSHLDMWDVLSGPAPGPNRMGATADVVAGPVRPDPRVLSLKKNKLVRHQLGEVLQDPTILYWQLRQRWKVEQTLLARDELYAAGTPIRSGSEIPSHLQVKEVVILRDPKKTPETIDSVTKAVTRLSSEDLLKLQSRAEDAGFDFEQFLNESNATDITDAADELFFDARTMKNTPEWVNSEPNLRVVPRKVAEARLGNVFSSSPTGNAAAIWGSLNGLARIALIYAPGAGARYIGRNYIQNMVLLALTNPSGFQHVLSGAGRALKENEPKLYSQMMDEIGSFQSTALPEFNTRARNKAQRLERGITDRSRGAGEALGKYADAPLRMAAYRSNAAKWGYESTDDLKRLLDPEHPGYDASKQGDQMRQTIKQQTRDDMIDFDALSPSEREAMTRFFFIWPFMRGAAKWPAMYLREYPGRAAAGSLIASSQGALTSEPKGGLKERFQSKIPDGVPGFGGKDVNFSWLSPTGVIENFAQAAGATATAASEGKINIKDIVGGYLAPQYKDLIELLANSDVDAKKKLESMVKEFVPGAKDILQIYNTSTGKQDLQQLALQFAGAQVTPSKAGENKAGKWTGEIDAAVSKIEKKQGPLSKDQRARVEKLKKAYGDWTAFESKVNIRNLNEGKSKGLTGHDRLSGMIEVATKNYPTILEQYNAAARARGFTDIEALVDSGVDKNGRARWVADKMYASMFGSKEKLTRAAK